jgi:hypothetical protein
MPDVRALLLTPNSGAPQFDVRINFPGGSRRATRISSDMIRWYHAAVRAAVKKRAGLRRGRVRTIRHRARLDPLFGAVPGFARMSLEPIGTHFDQ